MIKKVNKKPDQHKSCDNQKMFEGQKKVVVWPLKKKKSVGRSLANKKSRVMICDDIFFIVSKNVA